MTASDAVMHHGILGIVMHHDDAMMHYIWFTMRPTTTPLFVCPLACNPPGKSSFSAFFVGHFFCSVHHGGLVATNADETTADVYSSSPSFRHLRYTPQSSLDCMHVGPPKLRFGAVV